ncbi:MAG: hypothetical protein V2I26_06375, partial [Halieaceae bacterium]|nr:hypothetical protein [Halieaceae bacterium]
MKKIVASSVVLLSVSSGHSIAAPVLQVKSQASESLLELKSSFLQALDSAGITTAPVGPAKKQSKTRNVRLPVSGGAFDLNGFIGEVNHAGGLRFAALDGTKVKLHNLSLESYEGKPRVTALVQINARLSGVVPLFDIAIFDNSTASLNSVGKVTTMQLGLALTQEASDLFNTELGLFLPAG